MYGGRVLKDVSRDLWMLNTTTLIWTFYRPIKDEKEIILSGTFGASTILMGPWFITCFGIIQDSQGVEYPSKHCSCFNTDLKQWHKPNLIGDLPQSREGNSNSGWTFSFGILTEPQFNSLFF